MTEIDPRSSSDLDAADECAEAALIASGANGAIEVPGDRDVFRVEMAGSGMLSVTTSNSWSTDTFGTLMDAGCRIIAEDDDGGSGRNFAIQRRVSAGTYFVAVEHYDGHEGVGPYFLEAEATPDRHLIESLGRDPVALLEEEAATPDFPDDDRDQMVFEELDWAEFHAENLEPYSGPASFWDPASAAEPSCSGPARAAIDAKKGQKSLLGAPTTIYVPLDVEAGCYRGFDHGVIFWHPKHGAHEVHGGIKTRWSKLGWETLGYPLTDETKTADGAGRYNHFQKGSIYWHPQTGAHMIDGAVQSKWVALGAEKGFLGYPVSDTVDGSWAQGRFSHFQQGSIFWHPQLGAHEVHGEIRKEWASLGWEGGSLGYPGTDEKSAPKSKTRYSQFQYGAVYWHPAVGTHATDSFMDDGWLFDFRTNITATELASYVMKDKGLAWFQEEVAVVALEELEHVPLLCGNVARNRYGASGAWCSEFAAWVLQTAEMDDIHYVQNAFNNVYLHEVTLTAELVMLFHHNGKRFKWAQYGQVTPTTAQPGDYLSLTTLGKKKNHSALVVGVTYGGEYLWIAEGNAGDCLNLRRIDFIKDGKLAANIDGIGVLDSGLFGSIGKKTF